MDGSTAARRVNSALLLVGSLPADSAESALRSAAGFFRDLVFALPDGVTGPRAGWVSYERERLVRPNEGVVTLSETQSPTGLPRRAYETPVFGIRPGTERVHCTCAARTAYSSGHWWTLNRRTRGSSSVSCCRSTASPDCSGAGTPHPVHHRLRRGDVLRLRTAAGQGRHRDHARARPGCSHGQRLIGARQHGSPLPFGIAACGLEKILKSRAAPSPECQAFSLRCSHR
jgi:hypothetical protein